MSPMRSARRGATHGNLAARLAALEARAATKTGGPMIGIEDRLTGEVRADNGQTFPNFEAFFADGRRGRKLPLLISCDRCDWPRRVPEGGPK